MKKIFIYNRPAFIPLLWYCSALFLGVLLFLPPYFFVDSRIRSSDGFFGDFSVSFLGGAVFVFAIFLLASFLLWLGIARLIKFERVSVDQEFISISGGLFLSSGKRFYTGGPIRIPLTSDFRFRALKDGFSKSVGFYVDLPVDGGWHSFLIVPHCPDPFRLARRINAVLEAFGSAARSVHMSEHLQKQLYKKKGMKAGKKAKEKEKSVS
ncbi:hypothetical protein EHQ12_05095 [Leptospira gomenensis]|uniref:Uncharacterized protein n=1 Tax=Leptospira gomenensis TaxID=2484974 RepID=A0A5F1Y789_9LEPT|nr:hypothetical protein [Leptospira gomenensis]TGK28936.1 hypothetical protein EHQ17_16365 [Leptospira gomenensis]TGK40695.1 hypothetical protein EHQ07_17710 [Leptospira gomenensis]TGK42516.1 hypothetical protein EHQ12_05095 [Leptospira gomenensis]TGK68461.1 hypothetical protein EHQ13_00345 [Leptospira gomenensis]